MGEKKQRVAVIFGGQSSEHEVSCKSAVTVISHIDRTKYEPVLIGITKEGCWLKVEDTEVIRNDTWRENGKRAILSPDAGEHGILVLGDTVEKIQVDVIFPVLHGMYGEDGTIQGLFELAKIPYVGCGVFASAVSMDKLYTKIIVDHLGIRQAKFVGIHAYELEEIDKALDKVEEMLPYPVFVKPSKAGSSQGVNQAKNREELQAALLEAAKHDTKILVEETIKGREIECAVLGGKNVKASDVGEIKAADTFYTYEAKYNNPDSKTDTHPELPEGALEKVREDAVAIFKAVDGFGLSRVDFFLEHGTNEVIFNEINTLPGFTNISMYPMLWREKGIDTTALVTELIELAFERK